MSNSGQQLVEVIKEEEIQKISADLIETVIDSTMSEGILKEIPILSTIMGGYNAFTSMQDKMFLKKMLTFLHELKSVSQDRRIKQIIKIEDDTKYRTKVGEKLLFIISRCDDLDKASMVGILFKCYLEEKVDYSDFLSCVSCIELNLNKFYSNVLKI